MPAPIHTKRLRKYRDLDLDMLVHPLTNDIVGRSDVDAINGSIIRIIRTQRGERVFQSAFGSKAINLYTVSTGRDPLAYEKYADDRRTTSLKSQLSGPHRPIFYNKKK